MNRHLIEQAKACIESVLHYPPPGPTSLFYHERWGIFAATSGGANSIKICDTDWLFDAFRPGYNVKDSDVIKLFAQHCPQILTIIFEESGHDQAE